MNARKVVQYTHEVGAGDDSDEYQGHGTHVCGTVVGSMESSSDLQSIAGRYSGVAQMPKLHSLTWLLPALEYMFLPLLLAS
jgi:hypothetical protein